MNVLSTVALAVDLALLVLGVLVIRRLRVAREARSRHAVQAERRRLARELHDGIAQDLAFIASQSERLARIAPEERLFGYIAGAAQRALRESRYVISGLAEPDSDATIAPELSERVRERATELAGRAGLTLDLRIEDRLAVSPDVEHAILRLLSEGISNTARHADAKRLQVNVSRDEKRSLVVRIADDGRGFDPASPRRRDGGGYGLDGMTERLRSLGGTLRLDSALGEGTAIEAEFGGDLPSDFRSAA